MISNGVISQFGRWFGFVSMLIAKVHESYLQANTNYSLVNEAWLVKQLTMLRFAFNTNKRPTESSSDIEKCVA